MIQLLFAGGALAALFLATGCGRKKKETTSAPTGHSGNPDGAASSSPSANHPQYASTSKKFTLEFTPESLAGKYYQEIKRLGVAEEVLDQGCFQKKRHLGKQDRLLSACEVFNYVLEDFQKFSELDQGMEISVLPWVLDDNDPKTDFDEKIRKRIDATIQSLKAHPELKDLDPNSDEFKIKLATALMYFADFPKTPQATPWQLPQIRERTAELREIGLASFQEELFKKGGLGASELKEEPRTHLVSMALEALENPLTRGTDITKANVLFAVFERAGLLPKFYYTPMKYTDPLNDREFVKGNTTVHLENNVVVGIPLKDGPRVFNLKTLDSNGEYPEITPGNLADYLGHNLRTKGYEILLNTGQTKPALRLLMLSLELTPNNPASHSNVGIILEKAGKLEEAEKAYRDAIRLDPKFPWGLINMARLHERKGKFAEAVSLYYHAFLADPENVIPEFKTTMLAAAKKVLEGDSGAKEDAQKLIQIIEKNSNDKK